LGITSIKMLTCKTMNNTLAITENDIRRHGPGNALAVVWRQWRTERRLKRRGVHFRNTNIETVAAAYRAMSETDFDAVNARQDWANWRTIPRCLCGRVPDRALRVLDLGCGTGSSTRVLAWYAPAGSHVTGYELAEPLVDIARERSYHHRTGAATRVDFVGQGVTETLRAPDGGNLDGCSVDVVNASGIVGHHLNATSVLPLIAELRRVLRPEGIAMLDVGPTLTGRELRPLMDQAAFTYLGHFRSGWWDPTGEMVFRILPRP
jgi:SAM-dependent methyltransferase